MSMIKKLGFRGDTIVEVLICMAIVGSALSASYGITNRSLARTRGAQERTESLKYAEQQVERLKEALKNPTYQYGKHFRFTGAQSLAGFPNIYAFCFDGTLTAGYPTLIPVTSIATAECRSADLNYKFAIFYDLGSSPPIPPALSTLNPNNEFYIFSGRYSNNPNESVNALKIDVVNLMYRAHP